MKTDSRKWLQKNKAFVKVHSIGEAAGIPTTSMGRYLEGRNVQFAPEQRALLESIIKSIRGSA